MLRRAIDSTTDASEWVHLDAYNPDEFLFAPAEHSGVPSNSRVHRAYASIEHPTGSGKRVHFMKKECFEFATAEDSAMRFRDIAHLPYTHLVGASSASGNPENAIANIFSNLIGHPHRCSILGVEVPLHNPHFLFAKPTGSSRRCFLQHTMADLVLHVTPASQQASVDARGHVVICEYKVLMENNNPIARVTDWKNASQVLANARLFQLMTGVQPSYGALLYCTRRGARSKPAENTAVAYVVVFPMRADAIPAHASGIEVNEIKEELQDFFERCKETVLSPGKGKPRWTLYADGDHAACFEGGIETIAEEEVKAPPI